MSENMEVPRIQGNIFKFLVLSDQESKTWLQIYLQWYKREKLELDDNQSKLSSLNQNPSKFFFQILQLNAEATATKTGTQMQ